MTKEDAFFHLGLHIDDADIESILSKSESKYAAAFNNEARKTIDTAAAVLLNDFPVDNTTIALQYLKLNTENENNLKKILARGYDNDYKCPAVTEKVSQAVDLLVKKFRLRKTNHKEPVAATPLPARSPSFVKKYRTWLLILAGIVLVAALSISAVNWWVGGNGENYTDPIGEDTTDRKEDPPFDHPIEPPPPPIALDTTVIELTGIKKFTQNGNTCEVEFDDPEVRIKGSGDFMLWEVTFFYKNIDGSQHYRYRSRFSELISDHRNQEFGSTEFMDALEPDARADLFKNHNTMPGICEFLQDIANYELYIYKISYTISPKRNLQDKIIRTREYPDQQ